MQWTRLKEISLKKASDTHLQHQTEQVSSTSKDQDWEHSLSPSIPLLPFLPAGSARRLRAGREGDDRGWDGWMALPIQWTRTWINSEIGKDREAWHATVHAVKKSQTQLGHWTTITMQPWEGGSHLITMGRPILRESIPCARRSGQKQPALQVINEAELSHSGDAHLWSSHTAFFFSQPFSQPAAFLLSLCSIFSISLPCLTHVIFLLPDSHSHSLRLDKPESVYTSSSWVQQTWRVPIMYLVLGFVLAVKFTRAPYNCF